MSLEEVDGGVGGGAKRVVEWAARLGLADWLLLFEFMWSRLGRQSRLSPALQ